MIEALPLSITLSAQQKEALEVITEELGSLQDPDWPPRVILLWSDGISQSDAAMKLGIGEEAVERVRRRWLSASARIGAAEAKVGKAFRTFFSLVCDTLSQESRTDTAPSSRAGITKTGAANQEQLIENIELRGATRALIEIIHHPPKVYGINRSNWTLQSLAEAFEKLYGQKPSKSTVSRLLRQGGLRWKKSRKLLTSPDPNYREKVDLLLKTLQSLKPDEDLFFIDELGPLQVKRYGGRCYTPKGETRTHPQNQCSKGAITLYGALSANTNQMTWFYHKMLQLIDDRCGVILVKKSSELDVVTVASIRDHFGVNPSQVASLFALTEKNGRDSVLTQRQAVRFLELHGTLETVLQKAAAGDLGQVGRKLVTRSDTLRECCRELELRAAALGDMKGRHAETKFIEEAEPAALVLKEYGFWSLVRLLPFPERELVRDTNLVEENPTRHDYRAARTQAELDELHKMVEAAEVCALDTEASDKDPRNAVLYGVAFSVREKQAVYVPLMEPDLDGASQEEVRTRLARIFRTKTKFVGHNIKFDYLILRKHGMHLRNIHFDTMLAAGECFGDWDFFNLGEVARRLLGTKIKRYGDIVEKEQTVPQTSKRILLDSLSSQDHWRCNQTTA